MADTCPALAECAYGGPGTEPICRTYCGDQHGDIWSEVSDMDLGWPEKNALFEQRMATELTPLSDLQDHHREDDTMMTAAPTPEAFLAEPSTDEDEFEELEEAFTGVLVDTGDPLESIAASMRQLVDVMTGGGGPAQLVADLEAEVSELEALHDAKQALIEEVLRICKPSTSKLANSIRAVLEPPVVPASQAPEQIVDPAVQCPACSRHFVDQELLDRHSCSAANPPMPGAPPAHDADVEEWRAFAQRVLPPESDNDLSQMNRSQIRTLLGIPQTEG